MNNKVIFTACFIIALGFSSTTQANSSKNTDRLETISTKADRAKAVDTISSISRIAGICSIYIKLFEFQNKFHMEGGEVFIAKFMNEQNMTRETFSSVCKKAFTQFAEIENRLEEFR